MSVVTLSQQIGDRTITLDYADPTLDAVDLARQAAMAMKLLVAANKPKPAGWSRLSDEVKLPLIEAHDRQVWSDPCSNPDPEERVA